MDAFRAAAAAAAQLRRPRKWLPSYSFPQSSSSVRKLDQVALEDMRLETVKKVVSSVGRSDDQILNVSGQKDVNLLLGVATLYPGMFSITRERRTHLIEFTAEMSKLYNDQVQMVKSRDELLSINVLRKMLMMANEQEILLTKLRWTRKEFGFSRTFDCDLVNRHPKFFNVKDGVRGPVLKLASWDQHLTVTAREKSLLWDFISPKTGFHLVVESPVSTEYEHFQKLIFPSPYEYWRKAGASPCIVEKRTVALLHEMISMMPRKRSSLPKLELFKTEMTLPDDPLFYLLRHPGIFYVCRAVEPPCIFLRESFFGSELKYKGPEDFIRDRYLILMQRKPAD